MPIDRVSGVFVSETDKRAGCSESEPQKSERPMTVRKERRSDLEKAELSTLAKATIVGEELNTRSQQLFSGWEDDMSGMSYGESTESLYRS